MRKIFFPLLLCGMLMIALILPARAEEYDDLLQQMIDSVETGEKFVLEGYKITADELTEMYFDLYNSGALPWYADTYFDWTMGPDGYVAIFDPRGMEEQRFDGELYERKMAELLAATCMEGLEPWQMALNVHDYIITHCAYDEMLIRNTGYQALVNGKSACYGYAQLYMDVMNRIGIPCQIAVCEDMGNGAGHAWNVIQLEGEWYHVDLTWDDPVEDAYGLVLHTHFLKSDAQFMREENGHDFGWECKVTCDGGVYSKDSFWDATYSQIICADPNTVYLRRVVREENRIYMMQGFNGEDDTLYAYDQMPLDLGYGSYLYTTYGLSLWNGRLYFNSEDRVYSMLTDGSDLRTEYTHDIYEDGRFIFSSVVDAGVIRLELADHDFALEELEIPLEGTSYHTHDYTAVEIAATCAADGYTAYSCECGITYRAHTVNALEHQLVSVVLQESAQGTEGLIRHSCSDCDYYEDEITPALPTEAPATELTETTEPGERQSEERPHISWLAAGIVAAAVIAVVIIVLVLRKRK